MIGQGGEIMKKLIYGKKKLIGLWSAFAGFTLAFALMLLWVLIAEKWDLMVFPLFFAFDALFVSLVLINREYDVLIDCERGTVCGRAAPGGGSWTLDLEYIRSVRILSRTELKQYYKKHVPAKAICLFFGEKSFKMIPCTYLTEKQVEEIVKDVKQGMLTCRQGQVDAELDEDHVAGRKAVRGFMLDRSILRYIPFFIGGIACTVLSFWLFYNKSPMSEPLTAIVYLVDVAFLVANVHLAQTRLFDLSSSRKVCVLNDVVISLGYYVFFTAVFVALFETHDLQTLLMFAKWAVFIGPVLILVSPILYLLAEFAG